MTSPPGSTRSDYRLGVTAAPPDVSVIVLTVGDRAEQLRATVDNAFAQDGVAVESDRHRRRSRRQRYRPTIDDRARVLETPATSASPPSRNRGSRRAAATAPRLSRRRRPSHHARRARRCTRLRRRSGLAVVALRIVDDDGETTRRHVPRIGSRRPGRSGPVTSFLGGPPVVATPSPGWAAMPASSATPSRRPTSPFASSTPGGQIRYDGTPAVVATRTGPVATPRRRPEHTMRDRVLLVAMQRPRFPSPSLRRQLDSDRRHSAPTRRRRLVRRHRQIRGRGTVPTCRALARCTSPPWPTRRATPPRALLTHPLPGSGVLVA